MNTHLNQVAPWAVLGTTGLAVFAAFLDTTVLFVAFAAIGRDFPGVSPAGLSWVLNAYTIVFAATLIPAGRLADRIGRDARSSERWCCSWTVQVDPPGDSGRPQGSWRKGPSPLATVNCSGNTAARART